MGRSVSRRAATPVLISLFLNLVPSSIPVALADPAPSCNGVAATIVSNAGSIVGTSGNDVIVAGSGNNIINAGDGDDIVCGGGGNDVIVGGNGHDQLFGEAGADTISGNDGNDWIVGDSGIDLLVNGGNGTDFCEVLLPSNCETLTSGLMTIVEDASPNADQDFAFTGVASYSLDDDDGTNSTLFHKKVLVRSAAAGSNGTTYVASQTPVSDWDLTGLSCVETINDNSTEDTGTSTATIKLNRLEKVTCTFTNTFADADSDGVGDSTDNCPLVANPGQEDTMDIGDGYGDACSSDTMVVVRPSSMNGWSFTASDSTAKGDFVLGPDTPPLQDGSLRLRTSTDGNQYIIAHTANFDGIALSDITAMGYSTYVSQNGDSQAPYLSLVIDYTGDNIGDDRLYFEPVYQNGTYSTLYSSVVPNQCGGNPNCVTLNTWQTWDTQIGGWWSLNESAGGPPLVTLEAYATAHPLAKIVSGTTGGVRLIAGAGAPVWNNFNGNVDAFIMKENGNKTTTDFETEAVPPCVPSNSFDTFSDGSVNGQGGWESTGSYDQEVVPNIYGLSTFGCKSLRISNAVTSGAFGDQTFSFSTANEAGETSATNGGKSGGTRQDHFDAQFDIATTNLAQQPGLILSVSPDRGDGARMSYLRFEDQADGVHVFFDDYTINSTTLDDGQFHETDIATLTRDAHTIKFSMDFLDGPSNDVVEIYIDGVLEHTGTSWEDYFRYTTEQAFDPNTHTVDSLIFRAGGTAATATMDNGFLFDNVDISTSTLSVPVAACVPTDGADFYLPFDEPHGFTAYDATGNGFDGTHTNGAAVSSNVPTLAINNYHSMDFDGVNDYVDVGHSSFATPSAFSVSAWVNPETIGIDRQIISKGYNGTQTEWEMKTTTADGKVSFQTFNNPSKIGAEAATPLTAGVWTHLVGTFDGTTWKIYVNGVLDGSAAGAAPIATNRPIYVGAVDATGTPVQFWNGGIDEVRFYDRALTQDEVSDLYGGMCNAEVAVAVCDPNLNSNLSGWWKFEEAMGSYTVDSSGNGNTAVVANGTWSSDVQAFDFDSNTNSFAFNGLNAVAGANNSASLNKATGDSFSGSAWVKANAFSGYQTVFHKLDDSNSARRGYLLTVNGGVPEVWIISDYGAGNYIRVAAPGAISTGAWHNIGFSYNGSGLASGVQMYVDGAAVAGTTVMDTLAAGSISNTADFEIGFRSVASAQAFDGLIDDVRLYNVAISAADAMNLAEAEQCAGNLLSGKPECSDGVDNDAGTDVDLQDADCTDAADDMEQAIISCTPSDSSLAAYWNMDEDSAGATVVDSTTFANNGTPMGTDSPNTLPQPSSDVPATSYTDQYSLDFDGTDDFVSVSDTTGLPSGSSARTIALWMKQDALQQQSVLVSMGNGASGDQKFMFMMGNEPLAGPTYLFTDGINGSNNITVSGGEIPSVGAWHHVAFVFDGVDGWSYYLDGSFVKGGIFPVAINTVVNAVEIGSRHDAATGYYDGKLDDVRIYNRALSGTEISSLAGGMCLASGPASSASSISSESSMSSASSESSVSSASSSVSSSPIACVPSDLLAFYKFDDNAGVTATDSTGNGYHGILENGPVWTSGNPAIVPNTSALEFDGNDDIVNVGNDSDFAFSTTDFTVSTFLKTTAGNRSVLGRFNNSGGFRGWGLYIYNTDRVNFFGYGMNGANDTSFAAPVLDNNWHNVVGVYSRSGVGNQDLTITVYVDGVNVGSHTVNVGSMEGSTDFLLGKYTFQPSFDGTLDDVRIYNRALSAGEVASLSTNCGITGSSASSESSHMSEGSSSSSSSEESFAAFSGLSAPEAPIDGGSFRGNRTNTLSNTAKWLLGNKLGLGNLRSAPGSFGGVPPGSFGGSPDVPFTAIETEVICGMKLAAPKDAPSELVDWMASYLGTLLNRDTSMVMDALEDNGFCGDMQASRLRLSQYSKPVEGPKEVAKIFPLDKDGYPVSTNPVFDACMRNGRVVLGADGRPFNCERFETGNGQWMHPDFHVAFTFRSGVARMLKVPDNFVVVGGPQSTYTKK